MPADNSILAYTGLALILTVTPGPDTLLVVRSAMARGVGAGLLSAAGILSGGLVHATLAALGLSTLLLQSAALFDLVKLAGAVYLCFLGIQSLWQSRKGAVESEEPVPRKAHAAFLEGFVNNALNPKVALFYVAFLPQFISPRDHVVAKTFLLVAIHYAMSAIWLGMVAVVVSRSARAFKMEGFKVWAERVTGVMFLGLGAKLALERR